MNTSKQINVMILLVFLAIFVTGAYTLWDPDRADEAEARQLGSTVERGAYLFSQNCRTCHGDAGEGGAASNRLRLAPALNRPDLRGEDAEGNVTGVSYATAYKFVYYTISCGRVGKVMPAWAQAQGGTLNTEQIKQLTTLILNGNMELFEDPHAEPAAPAAEGETAAEPAKLTGWEQAREFAIRGVPHFAKPGDDQYGMTLAEDITGEQTIITLNKVVAPPAEPGADPVPFLFADERLSIGDEILLIQSVDVAGNTVTVERGVGSTSGEAHKAGDEVLKPPVPPTGLVLERSCGQLAGAQAPVTAEPPSASMTIIAKGIAWNKSELAALPGVPLTITIDNQDQGVPHNFAVYDGADATAPLIDQTEIANGPVTQTLSFGPLEAGEYYYNCIVHPQMEGILTVGEGGAATPGAEGTPTPQTTPTPGGTPSPAATPSGEATTLELIGKNTIFDKTSLEAPAGLIVIKFDNQDGGITHDLEVYKGEDETGELMGKTELANGPIQQELQLTLEPGTYFYWCVVHPATMNGKLTVQ